MIKYTRQMNILYILVYNQKLNYKNNSGNKYYYFINMQLIMNWPIILFNKNKLYYNIFIYNN